jgi:hypothetical protein
LFWPLKRWVYPIKSSEFSLKHSFCLHVCMKIVFFILLLFSLFNIQTVRAQGKVEIIVEPEIKEAENERISRRKAASEKTRGYRIMIGFYSNRAQAEAIRAEAARLYGSRYGVTIIYDEPNFKVYVGEFTQAESADDALADVRKRYPGATRISDIIRRRSR